MNVLVLQVFVSLMLVVSSVLLFAYSVRHRDYEHADRLSLFPLEEERTTPEASKPEVES
ncbi:MAG: cytochrome oxidase [Myxococcaceae bacterium]